MNARLAALVAGERERWALAGRELNLRGVNARIVERGVVRAGDAIGRVPLR